MLILTGILLGSLLAPPAVFAADGSPPAVELEVDRLYQGGEIVEPSGEKIYVSPNEPLQFRLNVFEPGNRDLSVSVEDPANLLTVERAVPDATPTRLDGWNEILPGTYQTTYVFEEPGTFLVTVLPAVQDRLDLPEGSTDWVGFEVVEDVAQTGPGSEQTGPGSEADGLGGGAVIAAAALVLAVGLGVLAATRGKPRTAKEPVAHDTWWNSP